MFNDNLININILKLIYGYEWPIKCMRSSRHADIYYGLNADKHINIGYSMNVICDQTPTQCISIKDIPKKKFVTEFSISSH